VSAEGHAALWFTVVAFGIYHGVNPAMGWPLAVANGLAARRGGAVFATLMPLGAGHLLAMAVAVLPFALLGASAPAHWCCCSAFTGSPSAAIRAIWLASGRRNSRGGRS
jgi:hypothetical protein